MMEEVDLADTPLAMRPQLQSQDSSTGAAEDEPPDPRIQVELERLNTSTDLINKLEVDLDEARMMFRQTLLESTQQIDHLTKKLGKCVDQARPYYEARIKAKQALTEAQKSAVRYERAVSQHAAAREMVQLAEEGLLTRGCIFDSTWQEMLNHATTKVNDAEREKIESTSEHKDKSNKYHESETRVKYLQKELKRSIAKSSLNARRSLLQLSNIIRMQDLQLLPYFELKAAVNQRLEEQKRHVRELEAAVASAKANYSQALTNLETISDQIHKTRQNRVDLGVRGVGVGAESPGPPFGTGREREIASEKASSKEHQMMEKNGTKPEKDSPFSICSTKSLRPVNCPVDSSATTSCGSRPEPETKTVLEQGVSESSAPVEGNPNSSPSRAQLTPPVPGQTCQEMGTGQVVCGEPQRPGKAGEESSTFGPETAAAIEAAESHTSYLSGWQFVAFPNVPPSTNQSLLSVEDRESVVSDSESLTSIEMLSEEAIANLMLEDEINEATHSICTPHFSEEYLSPPSCKSGATLPPLVPGGSRPKETPGAAEGSKGAKNPSQASSSDSGEPWEVVSETQEPSIDLCGDKRGPKEDAPIPSNPSPTWKDSTGKEAAAEQSIEAARPGNEGSEAKEARQTSCPKEVPVETSKPNAIPPPSAAVEASRPQSLPVCALYSKSSSNSSSPITSNSLSEEFSPSYAPLSDTPEVETKAAVNPHLEPNSDMEQSLNKR